VLGGALQTLVTDTGLLEAFLRLNYVNRLMTNYFMSWDTTLFTPSSVTTT